jgi:hypothetical protein
MKISDDSKIIAASNLTLSLALRQSSEKIRRLKIGEKDPAEEVFKAFKDFLDRLEKLP